MQPSSSLNAHDSPAVHAGPKSQQQKQQQQEEGDVGSGARTSAMIDVVDLTLE